MNPHSWPWSFALSYLWLEKLEDRFSMSESQTALIFNLKFANINFPHVRKRSSMKKFGHFPWTENFFFFQRNSEARRTEIIQKWWIGFQDSKNLSSLRHTWELAWVIEGNLCKTPSNWSRYLQPKGSFFVRLVGFPIAKFLFSIKRVGVKRLNWVNFSHLKH